MPDPADHADNPNRNVVDRRLGTDRRRNSDPNYTGPERRQANLQADADTDTDRRSGLERRRGAGIRREEDRRSAEEGEMTAEQYEFIRAIETYKKVNKKLFPTWTEVLEVMEQLGYRKVEPRSIDLPGVPDPLAGENTRKPTDLPLGDTEDIEPEAEAA